MTPMRVLVTGSRRWTDAEAVHAALDAIVTTAGGREVVVVHGCAKGVDMIADRWVRDRQLRRGWRVHVERHPADWKLHGRSAGFKRNVAMVRKGADICLAFILDGSRGATGCAHLAEDHGIRTERFLVRTDAAVLPDSPEEE